MSDGNDFWGDTGKTPPQRREAGGLRGGQPDDKPGFWGKEVAQPDQPARPEGAEFWDKAEKTRERDQAERDALLKDPDLKRRRRRRLVKRVLLSTLIVVVLALTLGVVFLPQIASRFAPGMIEKKASEQIAGTVSVGGVALSWGGPQRVEGLRLLDPEKKEVVRATVESSTGLWGLIRGRLDLGEVRVTGGKADLVREADGSTNLARAVAPKVAPPKPKPGAKPPPASETRLPEGLRARLVVKGLDATVTDRTTPGQATTITVRDVDVKATIAPGEALVAEASLKAYPGLVSGRTLPEGGEVTLSARVDSWSRADGLVTLDRAKGKAQVAVADLPMALLDALVPAVAKDEQGRPVTLAAALGPTATVRLSADGDGSTTNADLDLAFANATLAGSVAYTGRDVRVTKTLTLRAKGGVIRTLAPGMDVSMANAGITLDAVPDVTFVVDRGAFPLPKAGVLDFRGVPMDARLDVGATGGRVVIDPSQPGKAFALDPITLRVKCDDLASAARITLATKATLEGAPAGALDADVSATGLLTPQGAFAGIPAGLNGTVRVLGIASSIAQPWASAAGLNLAQDVGPVLDVTLTATSDAGRASSVSGATGGQVIPPTIVHAEVRGEFLSLRGAVEQTTTAVRSVDDGVTLTLDRAGAIAARFIPATSGWRLEPGSEARGVVRLSGLNMPRDTSTGAWKLDQLAADVSVEQGPVVLVASDGKGDVRIASVRAGVGLRPGGTARVTADTRATHGGQNFDVRAAFDVANLYAAGTDGRLTFTPPMRLRPAGTLDAKGLLPALAGLFVPAAGDGELDLARVLADALAGPTDVRVAFKGVAGNADAVDASVEVTAPKLTAGAGGVVDRERASLRATTLSTSLSPDLVGTLVRTYAPSMRDSIGELTLAGPARVQVGVDPIVLPLTAEGAPALDRTGTARVRLTIAGQTYVDGLRVADERGTTRSLGRVGVEDFTVRAEVPVAAMVAPPLGEERTATVTLQGQVLGASGPAVLTLDGRGTGEFSHGKPKGPLAASLKITRANTRVVEQWLGRDGLLTGLMGPTADVEASVAVTPPTLGYAPDAILSTANIEAGVAVSSARLRADKPVRVRLGRDRFDLVEPATISISPDAVAATEFLRGKGESGRASLELLDAETIVIRLTQCSIPRVGASAATAPPAPAEINLTLDAPSITLRSADQQRIILQGTRFVVLTEKIKPDKDGKLPPGGPAVTFAFDVGEAKVGESPAAKGVNLTGRVAPLFAADGALDLTPARLNMTGQVPAAPTALLDALLEQDGAMLEALGPVIAVKVTVERLPLVQPPLGPDGKYPRFDPAPLIDLEARSPRATMTFRGSVNEGLYVSERPLEISVIELTSDFVKRYIGAMPLLGVAEKTAADAPALLRATGMTVPLDKNWARLNANIDLDPGQCRFQTSGHFANILKMAHQKTAGTAGARIDPLKVTIRNGVSTYERWRVPLGEFTAETIGVVNLTDATVRATRPDGKEVTLGPRSLDVVTWVPVGAVTDQALGLFNIGLGSMFARLTPGLLEPLTMLPFRTTGPMDNPSTKADSEMVGEGVKNQLRKLDPRRLFEAPKPQPTAPSTPTTPSTTPPSTPTAPSTTPPATPKPPATGPK